MNRLSTMELSEWLEKAASLTWNALNAMGKGNARLTSIKWLQQLATYSVPEIFKAIAFCIQYQLQCLAINCSVKVLLYCTNMVFVYLILHCLKNSYEVKSVSDDLMKAMKEGTENYSNCNPQPVAMNVVNDHAYIWLTMIIRCQLQRCNPLLLCLRGFVSIWIT